MFEVLCRDGLFGESGALPLHVQRAILRDLNELDAQLMEPLGEETATLHLSHANVGRRYSSGLVDHQLVVDENTAFLVGLNKKGVKSVGGNIQKTCEIECKKRFRASRRQRDLFGNARGGFLKLVSALLPLGIIIVAELDSFPKLTLQTWGDRRGGIEAIGG